MTIGKKIAVGVAAALGGFIVVGAVASGDDASTRPSAASQADSSDRTAAKIGSAVRDGKFEFTVTGLKTRTQLGSGVFSDTAQGRFVVISVEVRNIGDESQLFDASSQQLFDATGRRYSADSGAALYLGKQARSFLEQINPGNSVKGFIVFDVPKGAKLSHLLLHDSLFSGGVEVKLTK